MSGKIKITEEVEIGEIIALKGERAEKIIQNYFFDSKKLSVYDRRLTLKKAARKSGKDYKLLGILTAINVLPDKSKKRRR